MNKDYLLPKLVCLATEYIYVSKDFIEFNL